MQALVSSLERVVEAADWFVRTPSLRLLHVTTTSLLRNAVLSHLAATEMLPHARAPFFVLEAPVEPSDDGWALRAEELRFDWSRLAATAPSDVRVPPLPSDVSDEPPLVHFARHLADCLERLPEAARSLVVVLAPIWIRTSDGVFPDQTVAARWREDLEQLLTSSALGRARFVVVETDSDHTAPVARKLGARADSVCAVPDEDAIRAESDQRLSNLRAAPVGATGTRLVGGAGPAVLAPPRIGEKRSSSTSASPTEAMRLLHIELLSGAAAMRDGDVVRAAGHQREAVEICSRHGMTQEAIVNELVLGGYLVGTDRGLAIGTFTAAEAKACTAGRCDLMAQARMAIAACRGLDGHTLEAAVDYADAAQLAERAGSTAIAIECFRTSGQLLLSVGDVERGAMALRRALDVAGATQLAGTTAPDAARALASLCRSHGLDAQARSLEEQARALDDLATANGVET